MKLILIFLSMMLFTSCADISENEKKRGKLRKQLFVECMQLASKITRVGDDDVSDIIDECDSYALYTARHII